MRGRFYAPRESQIPRGAIKVSDKLSDAVAYLYPCRNDGKRKGLLAMTIFYGRQSKPVTTCFFLYEANREAYVKKYFAARQQHDEAKAAAKTARLTDTATVQFQVGKTYYDRAASDWDTIYAFKIISRTAKQLTIEERGETYKRGIYVYNGVEWCKPHGTYSMCAVIRADLETL